MLRELLQSLGCSNKTDQSSVALRVVFITSKAMEQVLGCIMALGFGATLPSVRGCSLYVLDEISLKC